MTDDWTWGDSRKNWDRNLQLPEAQRPWLTWPNEHGQHTRLIRPVIPDIKGAVVKTYALTPIAPFSTTLEKWFDAGDHTKNFGVQSWGWNMTIFIAIQYTPVIGANTTTINLLDGAGTTIKTASHAVTMDSSTQNFTASLWTFDSANIMAFNGARMICPYNADGNAACNFYLILNSTLSIVKAGP